MKHLPPVWSIVLIGALALAPAGLALAAPAQATCASEYIVKSGDWIRKIARQFNVDWQELVKANSLTTPDLIYPGQKLCIPAAATTTKTATPTRTATGPTPTRTAAGPTPTPTRTAVPAVVPSFRIVKVVKGQSVTIETANFPAGVKFDVRFGAMGTRAEGGAVAATQDSGKGGTFQATFTIPAALKTADQIALRLDNAATGYFAYNWFFNADAP